MQLLANIAVGAVAAIHVYILILELFLWSKPAGRKAFGFTQDFANQTRVLGANQGLYNGFLAAGLAYGLFLGNDQAGFDFKTFFLTCVLIAGIYGSATANRKILLVQAIPAAVALLLVMLAR